MGERLTPEEELARELDRLENVLRQDPYRDDIRRLYQELLERLPAEERKRRDQVPDQVPRA